MAEQVIDWSFFSMAKYLLTARTDDPRVLSGREWQAFTGRLAKAGQLILDSGIPAAPADRASAFRGLLQFLYFGLERTLGSADPARPVFSRAWLLARDLRPDASGRFEILLGPKEQPGNWLEIVPATSYVLSREFFADWADAAPADLQIECLDDPADGWPVLSADRVARELQALGTWLVETVRVFAGAQQGGIRQFPNAFDPHVSRPDSDLPAIYHGYWDLRPGECLIVETPAPEGGYWSIQMANGLWNTLDYANRLSELDGHLPDTTPRVTPAQRRGALDERLRQVTRLQRS